MEYILWRYRNLSAIVHTTWRRPKHGGDQKLAGSVLLILNKPESGKIAYNSKNFEGEKIEDHILKSRD